MTIKLLRIFDGHCGIQQSYQEGCLSKSLARDSQGCSQILQEADY